MEWSELNKFPFAFQNQQHLDVKNETFELLKKKELKIACDLRDCLKTNENNVVEKVLNNIIDEIGLKGLILE